jgi:hypothetical protein
LEVALTPAEYRAVWEAKPTLRAVYREYYRYIDRERQHGVTVEIGAGSKTETSGGCPRTTKRDQPSRQGGQYSAARGPLEPTQVKIQPPLTL